MEKIPIDKLSFSSEEDIEESSDEIIVRLTNGPPQFTGAYSFPDFSNQDDKYRRPSGKTLQILAFGENKSMSIRVYKLNDKFRFSI
ncbi:MAG TPA: hypothetical protein HA289_08420 [Ferroplasma sp.]|jgi:hypothetical protein|nr:hypothetical protein [Ferroplasma sp.]